MERINKLQALMQDQHVSQIVVYEHQSIYYLTGVRTAPTLFLQALVVNATGKAKLIYYSIQRYEMKYTNLSETELVSYSQYVEPINFFAGYIHSDAHFDRTFPIGYYQYLERFHKNNTYAIDTLVDSLREVKDEYEIGCLREASRISDLAMSYARSQLVPGITEKELNHKIGAFIKAQGCELSFNPFVMFDVSTTCNRGNTDLVFTDKSCAMIDLGASYNGYHGDTTRMFFHRCNQKQYELYLKMKEANDAAKAAIKEGASFHDVDIASKTVMAKYGLFDGSKFPAGHSVGLSIHELDYVSSLNFKKLRAGMVFSVEPGTYYFQDMGARVEDLIVVTKNGCEVFNHTSMTDVFLD